MLNVTSEQNYIDYLDYLSMKINQCFTFIIFFFGVSGNIINILVLSQRTLRSNICAWLFLTSSIANLISLLFGLTTRIVAGWTKDPADNIDWICKCRAFLVFSSRTIAFWLVASATINRFLASSLNVRHRQINTLRNFQISSLVIAILSFLFYSQMLYCYQANLTNTPLKCYGKNTVCRLVSDIVYACFSITLPLVLMIVFGIRTIMHVHQSQRRIHHEQNSNVSHNRRLHWTHQDLHLFVMLFVQVIIQALLTFPQAITKIYISITIFDVESLKLTVDRFVYNVTLLLSFVANSMPFYIYTLFGGNVFRKPLLELVKKIIFCKRINI